MLYTFAITIPPNTPEPSTATQILPVTAGNVNRVLIDFPAGQIGLTHLRIRRGLYQVWPANPEADFSTSNATIDWNEDYDVLTPPYEFEAYAWNLDDTYTHTITVHISIEPAAQSLSLLEQVKQLLGVGSA